MSNYPFNKAQELKDVGKWPSIPSVYGMPMPEVRKFNTPITPRENFERVLRREKPLWIPTILHDFNFVQPLAMPDARARVLGGPDWFGIEWQFEKLSNAAMVKPGTRRLSDVTRWEQEMVWPDLDAIDWASDYEENYKPILPSDRPTMFTIVNGLFERLADLTSFEDTLCYLIEEPEAVESLFAKLTDWHIELFAIARRHYHADVITFHDDMGTQRASFFSPDMFREVMFPHYRRMNEAAHKMGLVVNFHSCGSVANQMENFCDAGFDFWEGQDSCNDKAAVMDKYGDRIGQVTFMVPSADASDKDLRKDIRDRVVNLGKHGNYILLLRDHNPNRGFRPEELLYELSRRYYSGEHV
jgi:hypothetical protein